MKKISAPQIDEFIEKNKSYPEIKDAMSIKKLIAMFNDIRYLEAQGDDEYRKIWITTSRGKIEDFGDFDEALESGEVDSREDFEALWKYYYPEETKWYAFVVSKYKEDYYFYIDSILIFQFQEHLEDETAYDFQHDFIDWLQISINEKINTIKQDIEKYNNDVNQNLPHYRRVGRIKRSDYWSVFPEEKEDFEKSLNAKDLEVLEKIVTQSKSKRIKKCSKMSSGKFFKYCEIGYDANEYFDNHHKRLSAVEKYNAMADGRDCDLKTLDENSYTDFATWYDIERNCGGHPWEICRGGNSTHISLYLNKEDDGWSLWLEGSSRVRVIETIKMAIALHKKNAPLILAKAEAIYNMAIGKDYIGIVPENVTPRYCNALFPVEDNIIDFMNMIEKREEIIEKAYWYPLEPVKINISKT